MALFPQTACLAIATANFDEMVNFYQALLGQTPLPFQGDRYAEFQLPGLRLALFRPKPDHQAEFSSPAQSPLSLCLTVTDLAAAREVLVALGAGVGEGAIASHGQEFYAYDPQGNRLIVYQPCP